MRRCILRRRSVRPVIRQGKLDTRASSLHSLFDRRTESGRGGFDRCAVHAAAPDILNSLSLSFLLPLSFSFLFWFPGMRETLTPSFVSPVSRADFGRTGRTAAETKILPFNDLLIVSHDDIKRRSRVRSAGLRSVPLRPSQSGSEPGPSSRRLEVLTGFSSDQESGSSFG